MKLSRRNALLAGAAAPFATGIAATAYAKADMKGASSATYNRFTLGAMEVTTLLAGSRTVEHKQDIFGMNVSEEEFAAASEAAFIPTDKVQFFFNPTIVNTGSELVLFDTGLSPASITGPLEAAGYSADQVDTVVISHMHGDHIGGMMDEGKATFANARYVTASAEFDHWNGADNDNFKAKVAPMAEQFTFLEDGGSVTSGITAMMAAGHTPGHTTYMIESEGQQVLITADLANHYVWSVAYPDWEVKFDMDKAAAAASRRKVLGMLAADKVPFIGYHMPFPGMGYIEPRDNGFRYVPASYQMML
ncbi:MAG: MBL fold metallo-hydrolase [Pseudomonadota bacterium]